MIKSICLLILLFAGTVAYPQWTFKSKISPSKINHVCFVNQDTGYVSGTGIYKSLNDGLNWTHQSPGVLWTDEVVFTGTNTGYALFGNTVLKTTNGGNVWAALPPVSAASFSAIYFTDSMTAYATLSDSSIVKTTNAAMSWSPVLTGIATFVNGIFFSTADTGYVWGDWNEFYWKTTNAGANWTMHGLIAGEGIMSMYFLTSNIGYAVGTSGFICKTLDGGLNWAILNSGTTEALTACAFTDPNNGCAVGWDGTILHTSDGGQSWSLFQTNPYYVLEDIQFVNSSVGYICGAHEDGIPDSNQSVIYRTTSGGLGWDEVVAGSSDSFDIYPNPAGETVTLENHTQSAVCQISISSINGQCLLSRVLREKVSTVDISGLPGGMYFITISNDTFIETKKIIKE